MLSVKFGSLFCSFQPSSSSSDIISSMSKYSIYNLQVNKKTTNNQLHQLFEYVNVVQGQEHLVEAIIKGTKIQS